MPIAGALVAVITLWEMVSHPAPRPQCVWIAIILAETAQLAVPRTTRTSQPACRMSACRCKAENICSQRVFPNDDEVSHGCLTRRLRTWSSAIEKRR